MWDYSDKIKDHFENPRNVGEVERADGVGEVGSLACGDALRLTIQVGDQELIEDARFKTFGCASAIASSSALTEMVKGLSLDEASKITNQDIADYLGGMPREKMHCSVMGMEALEAAIANFRGEKPREVEGDIICECFGVTDKEIERVVEQNNLSTLEEVTDYTKAGGGCGKCHERIEALLFRILSNRKKAAEAEQPPRKLTNLQKIKLIEETIDREIRPALRTDGGDIELVDVDGNTVSVSLKGTCASCAASQFTLTGYVEQKLKEFVTRRTDGRGGEAMKVVYVDNNATSQTAPEVVEDMAPYFSELYGNPSSMHYFGGQVEKELRRARGKMAELLGASPDEIVFTSCGTESDSTAVWAALRTNPEKKHVITSRVEHPAVNSLASHLRELGYRVTEIGVDRDGRLNLDDFEQGHWRGYGHNHGHVGQ